MMDLLFVTWVLLVVGCFAVSALFRWKLRTKLAAASAAAVAAAPPPAPEPGRPPFSVVRDDDVRMVPLQHGLLVRCFRSRDGNEHFCRALAARGELDEVGPGLYVPTQQLLQEAAAVRWGGLH